MITFLSLAFTFSNAFSSMSSLEAPFPKNWCSTGRCSTPQMKIWSEFNSGKSPSWNQMPRALSGSCYHSSRSYRNTTEHFSGFIIDQEQDGFSLAGRHSFYAPENPYADLDADTAREEFKKGSLNRIEVFKDYGFYNANPDAERSIRYWFREGDDNAVKMAIIFGNLDHFILCDLNYHQN